MKKTIFIVLVVIAMLAMGATSAFAAGYKVDTGWSVGADGDPATLRHSGYATTTNACKACHDVHGAGTITALGAPTATPSANLKLYRWDTSSDGCNACHLGTSALSAVQVYTVATALTTAEHTLGVGVIPDSAADAGLALDGVNTTVLDCFDCHDAAPHGAGSTADLIKADLTTVAGVNAYCGTRCHDLNDGDVTSHSLKPAPVDGVHAFVVADSCYKCHTSAGSAGFPHQDVDDYAFLGSATLADSALDAKCVSCHISGGSGVGLTY